MPAGEKAQSATSLQKVNIQAFQENKGFEIVSNLVKMQINENGPNKYCPMSFLLDLLEPTAWALQAIKDESVNSMIEDLFKLVTERCRALGEKDLKDFQRTTIEKLFNLLEYLKPKDAISKDILTILLNIAIQLIKSPFIQKKLLGLSLVKDMIQKTTKERAAMIEKGILSLEWKEQQLLVKTLGELSFAEIILGENANAELLRKVEPIFLFLLKYDKFEVKHLELLWKCCTEKHEEIMRICCSLLSNLITSMPYNLLQELFGYVEKANNVSELMVKFIEQYTNSVITMITNRGAALPKNGELTIQATNKKLKSEPVKYKLFSLDLFWELSLDSSPAPGKIKDQAINALLGLLNKNGSLAERYIYKGADCIKEGKSVIRGMQILVEIDFAAYYYKQNGKKVCMYNLKEMNTEYKMIQNVLKDCEAYHCKVIKEKASKSELIKDIMKYVRNHFQLTFCRILELVWHLKNKLECILTL